MGQLGTWTSIRSLGGLLKLLPRAAANNRLSRHLSDDLDTYYGRRAVAFFPKYNKTLRRRMSTKTGDNNVHNAHARMDSRGLTGFAFFLENQQGRTVYNELSSMRWEFCVVFVEKVFTILFYQIKKKKKISTF